MRAFGCERCWPSAADAAWDARAALAHVADLIDESHLHVMLLACSRCTQRFASIFTETVDWVDGDDPQYWTLFPITAAQAADIVRHGAAVTEGQVHSLGHGRRCLRRDHPKGEATRTYWTGP